MHIRRIAYDVTKNLITCMPSVVSFLKTRLPLYVINFLCQIFDFVVVVLLFYVHGKHIRSCRDGQLT